MFEEHFFDVFTKKKKIETDLKVNIKDETDAWCEYLREIQTIIDVILYKIIIYHSNYIFHVIFIRHEQMNIDFYVGTYIVNGNVKSIFNH